MHRTGAGSSIGREGLASVVVFLVALPLCLGIALASGVPPALGLISGIIGGLVVGVLAGSPLQVTGPAAGLAVIVWELVQKHGLELLGPIVLTAGLIQLAAGLLRFGRYFRAIAPPVVYGMLAGIGVLIFAGQFHVMVDDKPRGSGLLNLISIPESVYKGVVPLDGSSHHIAAVIGLVTIASIVLWGKFRPRFLKAIPGPLFAVVFATALAAVMRLPIRYVDVPSNVLDTVVWPSVQSLARMADWQLLGAAAALAVIASAETLLCAVAVDRMHEGPRTRFDRELAAQGVGNILCGVFGALPLTGVIVRSAANVEAGAKTRSSAVLHGAWLLLMVAAFPAVLRLIPTSSLAGILVYTGFKLVNPANVRQLAQYGRSPVVIYFATLIGIVTTDLLKGVLLGIALTVLRLVYELTHFELRAESRPGSPRIDLYLGGAATFLGLPKLAAALDRIAPGSDLHVHVQKLSYIDHACLDALAAWEKHGERQGSTMRVEWEELVGMYERARRRPAALVTAAAGAAIPIATAATADALDAAPIEGVVALSASEFVEAQPPVLQVPPQAPDAGS